MEEVKKPLIPANNLFYGKEPVVEKEFLVSSSPIVKEFVEGKKDFKCNDVVTVQYINERGCLVETQWELAEYLRPVSYTHLTLPTNREV